MSVDLAVFAATSGHSGVDRVLGNLVPAIAGLGLNVDVLRIDGHGPRFDVCPPGVRMVTLGARHVATAIPALVRYLMREHPAALLADKDRVNRTALLARALARSGTRVGVRLGTTVSVNLAGRGWLERAVQTASMRWLYRHADAVLVPSRGAAADLAHHARIAEHRVQVVPSPVVTPGLLAARSAPAPHPWFADGVPLILGVGELSERKDFATLLRAFARLRATRQARLIVLGEGRQRGELESLAATLGVAGDMLLPGFVRAPYPWMAHAQVFALSSRWEGMPVVLIEALALGVPCVATDCPSGPNELLDTDALVPVGNDAALAAALARQLDAPPAPEDLAARVIRYGQRESARAYLAALGFTGPGTIAR
ncbi:MAG: glycosyltransferase [Azoarcus sp.]|nr:glycosyltransferase [Azoarcus sp.]